MKYLRPYKWYIALTMLMLGLETMAILYLPTIMARIVNDGIMYSVREGASRQDFIIQMGGLMLVITLLSGLAAVGAGFLAPRISAGAARDLRRDVFTKVESFSQKEFDTFSSASLITRCTNDVAQVQSLTNMSARMLIFAPIMGIGGIIMALNQAVAMSWIIALSVIVLLGFVAVIVPVVMPRFRLIQGMMDKIGKVARETLHGLMVIRAFNTQKHEAERFDRQNREILDISIFVSRVMAITAPAMTFILSGTQILVVWVGAHHIAYYNLQIGDMMAFMQYCMSVIFAFMMISMVLVQVPRAAVSAGRIVEVLEAELSIVDPAQPTESFELSEPSGLSELSGLSGEKGRIVFENVSFKYPGAEVNAVDDISFIATPGETTAIIGPTGAGKSTIAQLLLRFYDVTAGKITVGGTDIRRVRQADLRDLIGYIPQKGQLLSGTVASNISYGRPNASEQEIRQVAEVAQAMSFIEEIGFDGEISQSGKNVSGGQRQRLSIARALVKEPEILVFDDSFSALDFQTDARLRKALKRHATGATVIVIAQRIGTIMNAEQILVLDAGVIVGRGTHAELLASCEAYREIASSQNIV